METENRKSIERRIREISEDVFDNLHSQSKINQSPQRIDMPLFQSMLDEWGKLARYYGRTNWNEQFEGDTEPDLEIGVLVLKNFLKWTHILQFYKNQAVNRGENQLAIDLEDAHSTLNEYMQDIIDYCHREDDLEL